MSESGKLLDFGIGFKTMAQRLAGERAQRLADGGDKLSFGISYLDDALGGITRRDLILVGAYTGIGKTELVTGMAMANVGAGKRVHYFALEAESVEIERRMKYRMVCALVYQNVVSDAQRRRLNFLDWMNGDLDTLTKPFEDEADKRLIESYGNLSTYYRGKDFTADTLERLMLAIQEQTDLIILDHFHYIDTEDTNENRGAKATVKKIRDVVLDIGKPVAVVAHLRKRDKRSKILVPDVDEYHGSSDIPKIATKAIMVAQAHDQEQTADHLWPTYVSVAKCRRDGSRARYCGLVDFNIRSNCYASGYHIGRLVDGGEKFQILRPEKMPAWAKGAVNA